MREYDAINPVHFYECIKDKKIYLFGAGNMGREALEDSSFNRKIAGITDNDRSRWGEKIGPYTVCSPEILMDTEDVVLITTQYIYDVIEELEWMNVRNYFHYETLRHISSTERDTSDISGVHNRLQLHDIYTVWEDNRCYAHAMGAVERIKYTNSKNAFYQSYANGFRVFEIDVKATSDSEAIICHGGSYFKNIVRCNGDQERYIAPNAFNDLDEEGYPFSEINFIKEKVFGKYEVVRWEDILSWLEDYSDIFFMLDVKGGPETFLDILLRVPIHLRKRLIAQIGVAHTSYLLPELRKLGIEIVHLIEDYYCRLEGRYTNNELIRICLENKIGVLTLGKNRIDDNILELAERYGIEICAYNQVNTSGTVERLRKRGVKLFCTDDYFVQKDANIK